MATPRGFYTSKDRDSPHRRRLESPFDHDSTDDNYVGVFNKFCQSSTIHGTYFWGESRTTVGKCLWMSIVLSGVISAALIINNSFIAWKDNPVITSVAQIPIEQVPFPSITICPLGDTRFGFPEYVANRRGPSEDLDIQLAFLRALSLIHTSRRTRLGLKSKAKKKSPKAGGESPAPLDNIAAQTDADSSGAAAQGTSNGMDDRGGPIEGDLNPDSNHRGQDPGPRGADDCIVMYCRHRLRTRLTSTNLTAYDVGAHNEKPQANGHDPRETSHNCTLIREFETILESIKSGHLSRGYEAPDSAHPSDESRREQVANMSQASDPQSGEASYGQVIVQMIYERLSMWVGPSVRFGRDFQRPHANRSAKDPPDGPLGVLFPTLADPGLPDCREMSEDIAFLKDMDNFLGGQDANGQGKLKQAPVGSLIAWVFAHLPPQVDNERGGVPPSPYEHEGMEQLYREFFDPQKFPDLYSAGYGSLASTMPLPDLVHVLSRHRALSPTQEHNQANLARGYQDGAGFPLNLTESFFDLMRLSTHPPHVIELGPDRQLRSMPKPLIPFCWYRDKLDDGIQLDPYDEHYCNDFQTTFNDLGLCYTFNNFDLGLDKLARAEAVQVRKVQGCGKKKGLRVILDNQRLATLGGRGEGTKFQVFVTVPGVVTHKVPFRLDPTFHGEHSIYLHGIHYIDSSTQFKAWNKDNRVCYFPDDKKLRYFSIYTQDNCLLECRLDKIAQICQCAPWYLNHTSHRACQVVGNQCFEESLANYQDDLLDRVECDCKNDCEGIHIFSSMSRYSYADATATDSKLWWDDQTRSGRLANYLMDPEHVLVDPWTRNLSKMIHQLDDIQLANRRFKEDISVLNFFFDTPIITRITLEMKITVFDQISAVGGTLGLFTGVSLITFAEVFYWILRFIVVGARSRRPTRPKSNRIQSVTNGTGGGRSKTIQVQGIKGEPTSFGTIF